MEGLESVEDNVIKMSKINFEPNRNGIGYELFHCMNNNKDLLAQIDTYTEERDNYDQLLQRCVRTAIHLKKRNIMPNSIICVCSYNHLNSCVPYLAGLFIGAIVCCLDPTLSYSNTMQMLLQIKPSIIFVVAERKDMYNELLRVQEFESELIVFGTEGEHSFQEFLEENSEEVSSFVPINVDNVYNTAVIVFSSGTTGPAKGICLNHFVLHIVGKMLSSFFNTHRCYLSATLHWIFGVTMLINSIVAGATIILSRSFSVFDTWRNISKFKASLALVTARLAIAMVKDGKPDYLDANSFRCLENIIIKGRSMPPQHLSTLRELLPNVTVSQIYGLTEIAGAAMLFRPRLERDAVLLQYKLGSCGRPLPGFWYKIVSLDTGSTLGSNQIGELRLKTEIQLNNYHGLDSSVIWDSDDWIKTGDICYYDEDYCFYVVDQIKERIIFQSQHVVSSALENMLLEHSAVKEAAVIGLPDDSDGERPVGVVVLRDKVTDVTKKMLVDYMNQKLGNKQRVQLEVIIVDQIPHTPTDKIMKHLLKNNLNN